MIYLIMNEKCFVFVFFLIEVNIHNNAFKGTRFKCLKEQS